MATPALGFQLSKDSKKGVLTFLSQCQALANQHWNLKARMELIDKKYQREVDSSTEQKRARAANNSGDTSRLQNIVIPVVMPQVEAAVTYQASVFLQGTPIFGVVADPANADAAVQIETLIQDQQDRGGWVDELAKAFRDAFKYNLGCIEAEWVREVSWDIVTDTTYANGRQGRPKEILWEGNKLTHRDLYNTFWDMRVKPTEVSEKGEFAGYNMMLSRIALIDYINKLPYVQKWAHKNALESGLPSVPNTPPVSGLSQYTVPEINSRAFTDAAPSDGTNWESWFTASHGENTKSRIQYKNNYQVTVLYARILPEDFNLDVPGRNQVQIWKFIIVNNCAVIYAERQTNAHNLIPLFFFHALDDGLSYQTKSLADNVCPIQDITTTLMNANIAARRRALSDRMLYDPSRVDEKFINSPVPTAKIPVRPGAYGKPLSEAVYPFPFRDDQFQFNNMEMQQMLSLANVISGQNPAKQGQFVKGNKTKSEFDEIMYYANGRDQLISMSIESSLMRRLKMVIKANILQFQGGVKLLNRELDQVVDVDPLKLRQAMIVFKVSDGLNPSSKIVDGDSLAVAMQVIGSSPAIGAGYNIAPMFSYLMKMRGAKLKEFEKSSEQLAYEQAMSGYQQQVIQLLSYGQAIKAPLSEVMQEVQKLPMPKPEDYGYDPKNPRASLTTSVNDQGQETGLISQMLSRVQTSESIGAQTVSAEDNLEA